MSSCEVPFTPPGQIAIIWRVADVLEIRPDLTFAQAWQVLQEIKRDHESGIGINWSTLDYVAEELFGPSSVEHAA